MYNHLANASKTSLALFVGVIGSGLFVSAASIVSVISLVK